MKKQAYFDQMPIELIVFVLSFIEIKHLPKYLRVNKTWYHLIQNEFLLDDFLKTFSQEYAHKKLFKSELLPFSSQNRHEPYYLMHPDIGHNNQLYHMFLNRKKVNDQSESILSFIETHPDQTLSIARTTHSFFKEGVGSQHSSGRPGPVKKFVHLQPLILLRSLKVLWDCLPYALLLVALLLMLRPLWGENVNSHKPFWDLLFDLLTNPVLYGMSFCICYIEATSRIYPDEKYQSYLREAFLKSLQNNIDFEQEEIDFEEKNIEADHNTLFSLNS